MPDSMVGHLPVEASAARLRHYRYAVERVMRVGAGWIALTPELAAKLLLGRHVWDDAQHADLLGRRLLELRAPAQESAPAGAAATALLDAIESPETPGQTAERLVGVYRVLKPHLLASYRDHLARTNPVYEPPTRRILERLIADTSRHVAAGEAALEHLLATPALVARATAWQAHLAALLTGADGVTGDGVPRTGELDAGEAARGRAEAQEFVRLETRRGAAPPLPAELAQAVDALGDALVAGDAPRALSHATPESGLAAVIAARPSGVGFAAHRIVACARIGHRRAIKLRLDGAAGGVTLLLRWGAESGAWRVELAELVAVDLVPAG
jgi:hypothetical protein